MTGWRITYAGVARRAGTFATAGLLGFLASGLVSVFFGDELPAEVHAKVPQLSSTPDSAHRGPSGLEAFQQVSKAATQSEAAAKERIARIEAMARELPLGDVPAMAQDTAEWPKREREAFLGVLLLRWAEADPGAALAYCERIEDQSIRAGVGERAIQAWAKRDSRAALDWIRKQPEGEHRLHLVKSFIKLTEQQQPALALEACRSLPQTRTADELRERVIMRVAENDPQAAARAIAALPSNSHLRREVPLRVARLWIEQDTEGALKWLQSAPGGSLVLFEEELLEVLGERDPHRALRWVGDLTTFGPANRVKFVVAGWAKRDPAAARAYARSLPPGSARNGVMAYVLYELGTKKKDLPTIIAINRDRTPDGNKELEEHLIYMIREHAMGGDTIMATLHQLPSNALNQSLLEGFSSRWATIQPDKAAEYLQKNGLLQDQPDAAAKIAEAWAKKNPEHAVNWASGLPPGVAREAALTKALQHLATIDQPRAAQLMTQLSPEARANVSGSIALNWAERDPAGAAAWAAQLTDLESRRLASEGVAHGWASREPEECTQWLETIPSGPVRDTAVEAYAKGAMHWNPASAIQWAATVQDQDQRRRLLNYLAVYWYDRDLQSAGAWIKTTPLLSPATKQWVLSGR